jgi:hypothetical protein
VGSKPDVKGSVVTREILPTEVIGPVAATRDERSGDIRSRYAQKKNQPTKRKPGESMGGRRHTALASAVLVAGMVFLTMPVLGTASGAANSHLGNTAGLASLVVAGPTGFKSEAVDPKSRIHTGRINIVAARSADCDPTTLSPSQWTASVLRYFDKNPARPQGFMTLCVTQFRTASEAIANRTRILAAIGTSAISLKDIPGAYLHAVGASEQIFFAKGVYFVRVVSTDVSGTAMALTLGQNLTQREYNRLPK